MSRWSRLPLLLLALLLPLAAPAAQDALQQWRERHAEIRVAADPDFAPIDSLDAEGQQVGLAADYLRLIAERSGLRFRLVPVKSWKDALQALRERRVDLLSSAFASASRADIALFSAPYLRLPCTAFVLRDAGLERLDQIESRRIGVAEQHICQENLARRSPQAEIRTYASTAKALAALGRGEVEVLVGDLVSAQAAAARSGLRERLTVLGQIGSDEALGFAIRRDWPELKQILDAALADIDVAQETRLRQRWLKNLLPETDAGAALAGEALPPSLDAAIRTLRQSQTQAKNPDPLQTEAIKTLLDAAQADDGSADAVVTELRALRTTAASAADDAATLETDLLRDNTATLLAWRASLSERASVAQLEVQRSDERGALADAQARVAQLQLSVAGQHERPAQIRDELKQAQADVERLGQPAADEKDAAPALAEALRLRRQAGLRLALVRTARLEEELRSYEPRMRQESARLRQSQREVGERQHKVDALQSLILDRTRAVALSLNSRLQEEASELAQGDPLLREVARQNAAYGLELVQRVAHLAEVREARDAYARERHDTALALKNTRERIKYSGVSEAVGLILLAERRKLQPVATLKRKLVAVQTELAQTRIALIELRETSERLADPSVPVADELKRLPPDAAAGGSLRQDLYRLFATRADVVPQLSLVQNRLADSLADAEQELGGLVQDTAALRDLLDARLLWTPSHAPLDRQLLHETARGALDMIQPGRWWETLRQSARLIAARPLLALAGVALLGGLWLLRRRVPARLDELAQPTRRIRTDRYRLSGQALLLSLVAALPWPALVWLLARLLTRAGESGYAFADALGLALSELVAPLYALEFLRWLTVDKGLGAAHFRWSQGRRQALDLLRRWLTVAFLPIQLFLSLYFYYGEQLANADLARLVLVLASLLVSWLCWRVLAPGALWSQRSGKTEPLRLRQLLRLALTAHAAGLAVLAVAGYFLTAMALAAHFIESAIVLLAISVFNGMALRWLSLGERRLALKRMEDKRGEHAARDDAELESRPEFAAEAEQITLASINQQTRRLLRALTLVALVGVLLWVWSDVTPALAYLGDVGAWKTSYMADGKSVTVQVTLRALLFAAVVLMLTWIATRNIPGLLEIGVLRRLDVDAPTRYAITAVARYALAIVGTVFGLSLLGLRWGQLQWMAAALTVGLGFGLQEIFANFVSGLIVLFERPIRVGDVITIRGVEGTVTRIRTRATTIVDWDNREVVIPNKTFITDQLINWTLSDTTTRIVIKLSVANANDPDQVRALLLELARAHPKVLKEPAPNCWCVGIGSSGLDFELRAFVGATLERSLVRNDLHAAILRELHARGIAISLTPQMEVTLRQAPGSPPALVQTAATEPG